MKKEIKSHVHCSVDSELLKLIYQEGFSPSEILEFGIKFKLAELDIINKYPDNKLLNNISNLLEIIKKNEK